MLLLVMLGGTLRRKMRQTKLLLSLPILTADWNNSYLSNWCFNRRFGETY
jgi:hypothetical protein